MSDLDDIEHSLVSIKFFDPVPARQWDINWEDATLIEIKLREGCKSDLNHVDVLTTVFNKYYTKVLEHVAKDRNIVTLELSRYDDYIQVFRSDRNHRRQVSYHDQLVEDGANPDKFSYMAQKQLWRSISPFFLSQHNGWNYKEKTCLSTKDEQSITKVCGVINLVLKEAQLDSYEAVRYEPSKDKQQRVIYCMYLPENVDFETALEEAFIRDVCNYTYMEYDENPPNEQPCCLQRCYEERPLSHPRRDVLVVRLRMNSYDRPSKLVDYDIHLDDSTTIRATLVAGDGCCTYCYATDHLQETCKSRGYTPRVWRSRLAPNYTPLAHGVYTGVRKKKKGKKKSDRGRDNGE